MIHGVTKARVEAAKPAGSGDVDAAQPPGINAEAVYQAALRLFAERGYHATTMADIGAALGIRGPSLYRHVRSKQEMLAKIMADTMTTLLADQTAARRAGGGVVQQLRRAVEAHVRFHATHRYQAFVGNREIDNLEQPHRDRVLALRRRYENGLRRLITEGVRSGDFTVATERLASYAILDMGMGVAAWFRADGPHSAEEVAYTYAEFALTLLCPRSS
jgi:AcrR family transcriptional regulator